ncbi:MAG: FAD-binding protein [Candidatus Acetothermia bacterium]|jgi:D-lactate dehydrogenase (cytochrome)|nr:FAD-binding protein [Candidatus Acetothermia bacterium]MDH7504717.1 FAD-linked oxidase C-terminal domain-containing protein [Candidatus Acetothermia bacterium]
MLEAEDLDRLRAIVGPERLSTGESELELHSRDESHHPPSRPEAVVWPRSAEEISAILKLANSRKIPVTPWAGGTSLEGNPIPVRGGLVLDMRLMDRVLWIRPEDLQVRVEAGLDFVRLNERLERYGLFFPPDPGAVATIGGMVANDAKGIRAMKYGSTGDHVLGLEVVLPTGEIVELGSRAWRSSSGYDLKRLFIGSEGTLAVITEVTLGLSGLPAEFLAAVVSFASLAEAARAVAELVGAGLVPAALEFMDEETVALINKFNKLGLPERPTLFLEFQGSSRAALEDDLQLVRQICAGAHRLETGLGREERDRLWEARHLIHDTIRKAFPKVAGIVVDVAVPLSRYPELVEYAKWALQEHGLKGYLFGHAGLGGLHAELLYHPGEGDELDRAEAANAAIVHRALELGGTATGEHGVGLGKRRFMEREHGPSLELMRKIKALLDPNGIMNPGKVL